MQIIENERCVQELKLKNAALIDSISERKKELQIYKDLFWYGVDVKKEKSITVNINDLVKHVDKN